MSLIGIRTLDHTLFPIHNAITTDCYPHVRCGSNEAFLRFNKKKGQDGELYHFLQISPNSCNSGKQRDLPNCCFLPIRITAPVLITYSLCYTKLQTILSLGFQCQFPHEKEGHFKTHKLISNYNEELCFLKFDAMKSGRCLPSLRRFLLPPSSGPDDGGYMFLSNTRKQLSNYIVTCPKIQ